MRVLMVSADFGWPANTGFRQRISNTARALGELGDLTWLVCTPRAEDPGPAPTDLVQRVCVVPLRRRGDTATKLRWAPSRRPWRLHSLDLPAMHADVRAALGLTAPVGTAGASAPTAETGATAETGGASTARFDVVVVAQLESWAVIEPLLDELVAPGGLHALDIDDIESHKVRGRAEALWRTGGRRARAQAVLLRLDARRWQREIDHALATTLTYTASALDRERLAGRPLVLANVVPEPPAGYERTGGATPELVFVGSLTYEPNIDGLEHFVAEVLPRVRAAVPDAVLRIVGQGDEPRVTALAAAPGVELVGQVPSVTPELARAAAAVVPLRFGGGTRIKILEALAHGVPVVSTTVGAEGLGVRHEEHALIADTPDDLAAACVRILRDPALGAQLAANGATLVEPHRGATVRAGLVAQLRDRLAVARGTDDLPSASG